MAIDERLGVIEAYIEAYNRFDVPAMMALVHPDIVFINYSGDTVTAEADGLDQFRRLAELSATVFSERCQTVRDITSDAARVVVRIDYRGTLAMDLPGGPKTGETLALAGRSEFSFKDGKIVRLVDYS